MARKKKLARKYIIRRIVALLILLALIAGISVGVYALIHRSGGAGQSEQNTSEAISTEKKSTPTESEKKAATTSNNFKSQKAKDSGVPDCTANDVSLKLEANVMEVEETGTVTFTKSLEHQGEVDCLIDTSDSALVLIVSNDAGEQVYRSDACESDSAYVLLGLDDTYDKKSVWQTAISNSAVDKSIASKTKINAAGHGCITAKKSISHVSTGNYTAQLMSTTEQNLQSPSVKLTVTAKPVKDTKNSSSKEKKSDSDKLEENKKSDSSHH